MDVSEAFSPLRAIQHGVASIQRAPAGLLVGGFLLFVLDSFSSGTGGGNLGDLAKDDQPPEVSLAILMVAIGLMAVGFVLALVAFIVRCWFVPGWIRLHRQVLETGADSFKVLFSGGDAFLRMLGWRLLYSLIALGTFVAAALPGGIVLGIGIAQEMNQTLLIAGGVLMVLLVLPVQIYVALGLALGNHALVLEGLGPVAALDRSWELARGNRITLAIFFFVTGLFSLLGLLLCCIGMFVTRAISEVGTTEAFLLATVPGAEDWVVPREAGL